MAFFEEEFSSLSEAWLLDHSYENANSSPRRVNMVLEGAFREFDADAGDHFIDNAGVFGARNVLAPEEEHVSDQAAQAVPAQVPQALPEQVVEVTSDHKAHHDLDDLETPRQPTFSIPQPYGSVPRSVHASEVQQDFPLWGVQQNAFLTQDFGATSADLSAEFSSAAEARSVMLAGPSRPVADPTVPLTDEEKRNHVNALIRAMTSTSRAQDNSGMIKPFLEGKYSDHRIELTCWNVLDACISRQHNGSLQALYEVKAKPSSHMKCFADRFNNVVEALATQKTICKHLLDPLYLYTFVDDPVGSQKRVVANKNLNKRKGEVMNAGKQALGSANHSPANSVSSNISSSSISGASQLDDPFEFNPAYTTPQKQMSRTSSFAGSPDSGTRQAFSNLGIGSDHGSPMQPAQTGYVPNLVGPSPNLQESNFGPSQYGQYVSPHLVGAQPHHVRQLSGPQYHHTRQLSGPQPGFRAVFNTGSSGQRSRSRSTSISMAPAVMTGNMPQRQISGTPSTNAASTPGSRKRCSTSRDEVEMTGSSQKKQHK